MSACRIDQLWKAVAQFSDMQLKILWTVSL